MQRHVRTYTSGLREKPQVGVGVAVFIHALLAPAPVAPHAQNLNRGFKRGKGEKDEL